MYPSTVLGQRSNRYKVESELGSFWAGTQFRAFKEITLAAAGTYVLKMMRPVDIVIRGFAMHVNTGEMRCEIYRGATFSGTFSDTIQVIPKCEFLDLPTPIYQPQSTIVGGGSISGGTLFDLMHVKTAGASGQASTVQDSDENLIGAPANSVGGYKFLNPGNSTGTCIFSIWWEELPIK